MEFILELIVTYLFSYPGAFVRWLFLKMLGVNTTLQSCLKQDVTQNAAIGFLLLEILFIVIANFKLD